MYIEILNKIQNRLKFRMIKVKLSEKIAFEGVAWSSVIKELNKLDRELTKSIKSGIKKQIKNNPKELKKLGMTPLDKPNVIP